MSERNDDEEELMKLTNNFSLLPEKYNIFSSQIRLSTMLILNSVKKAKITDLVSLFKITPGKLDHHIKMLENQELIIKSPSLFPTRVQFTVEITKKGHNLLQEYLTSIKVLLKKFDLN